VQELATIATPIRKLPDRSGRNVHPAGLPKFRHSKEQIKAERDAAKKALDEKAQKERSAKERLAHMNLTEERNINFPHQHPPRLSAMIQKRHNMDTSLETDSDECFDLREADHSSDLDLDLDLDSDSQSIKAAKTATKVCV
jgi:hypothetical protein